MLRIILILLCAFSFGNTLMAQRWFRQGAAVTPLPVLKAEPRHVDVPRIEDYADFSPLSMQPDTVYSASMVKRWGWMEPLHIISQAEARHHSVVYRFTNRNAAGHWQRLDCIDAYGRPNTGQFMTYLVRNGDEDEFKDEKWNEKVQQTCGFDMVADASGREVLQERAYDAEGSLVYVFSRTKVAPSKYICAYMDGTGLPAEMRTNEGYTYGTLASLWENAKGYVCRSSFVDAEGHHKPNHDSASCSNFIYDAKGQNTGFWSSDFDGTRVIDVCGNSGMMQEFDAWGNVVKVTVMDDQWKPMAFISHEDPSNLMNGVIVLMRDYDKHGLLSRIWFTDAEGHRMTNASGVYERRFRYNDRGMQTELCDYGINGHPINNSDLGNGVACYRMKYDSVGNLTDVWFLDSLLQPCSEKDALFRRHYEYDSLGQQTLHAEYKMQDGKTIQTYSEHFTDSTKLYSFSDSTYRMDFYDKQGRKTLYSYFDKDVNPLDNDDGYAFNTYEYTPAVDADGRTVGLTITDTYYDKDTTEVFVDNYSKQVQYNDSLLHTSTIRRYAYSLPNELYKLQYDEKFETRLAQLNIDEFENVCHGAGVSNMCYYNTLIRFTPNGQFNALIARDEWDEPDYMGDRDGRIYCYNVMRKPSGDYYYDEDNRLITDFQALRDRLPKFMSVEVTDTTANAYVSGLRSNDLVLRYGFFEQPDTLMGDEAYKGNWAAKSCLSATLQKRVEVLRFHPQSRTYSLHRMILDDGTQKALGVKFHCIYRTRRQMQHIHQALDSLALSDTLSVPLYRQPINEKVAKVEADSMVMILPCTFTPSSFNQYSRHCKAPSIVLGAEMDIDGRKLIWKFGDGLDSLKHIYTTYQDSAKAYPLNVWFSANGYTADSLCITTSIQEALVNTPIIGSEFVERLLAVYEMWRHPEKADSILRHADATLMNAVYEQGQLFFSGECEPQACTFLKALADRNYKEAYSYITALTLRYGNGTPEDLRKAEMWNRKAMRAGDYWGLLRLGVWYQQKENYAPAIRYYEKLAQRSRSYRQRACEQLDECYKQTNDSIGRLRNSLYWNEMQKDQDLLSDIMQIADAYEQREPQLVADVYANVAYIMENVYDESELAYNILQAVRRLRGDLKCYDGDYSLTEVASLIHASDVNEDYREKVKHYMDDKLRVLHFTKGHAKGRSLGLKGDWFVLQLDQLEQTDLDALAQWKQAPVVRRPSFYLVKGRKVMRVDYDSELTKGSTYETLSPSRRAAVIRQFHEWKAKNPNEFDIQ